MGINFYLHKTCDHCGHEDTVHIGKSSMGWMFSLHVYPEDGIYDLEDYLEILDDGWEIRDEYGDSITKEYLLQVIAGRNPNLRRHDIDGVHCLRHGSGTWDIILGDFS